MMLDSGSHGGNIIVEAAAPAAVAPSGLVGLLPASIDAAICGSDALWRCVKEESEDRSSEDRLANVRCLKYDT